MLNGCDCGFHNQRVQSFPFDTSTTHSYPLAFILLQASLATDEDFLHVVRRDEGPQRRTTACYRGLSTHLSLEHMMHHD